MSLSQNERLSLIIIFSSELYISPISSMDLLQGWYLITLKRNQLNNVCQENGIQVRVFRLDKPGKKKGCFEFRSSSRKCQNNTSGKEIEHGVGFDDESPMNTSVGVENNMEEEGKNKRQTESFASQEHDPINFFCHLFKQDLFFSVKLHLGLIP